MLYLIFILAQTTILYMTPLLVFLPFKLSIPQKIFLFAATMGLLSILATLTGNMGIPILLSGMALALYIIDRHFIRNTVLLILSYFLNVLLSNLLSILLWIFTGIDIAGMHARPILDIAFGCVCILISYLASKGLVCLYRRVSPRLGLYKLPKKTLFFIGLNLMLTLCLFVTNIIAGEIIGYSATVVGFNTFVFFAYFILSVWTIIHAIQTYRQENELQMRLASMEAMQKYTEQVEELYNSMRAFKHDYANIMTTMYEYIDNKDMEGLSGYFHESILPQTARLMPEHYELGRMANLKIPQLKSLVTAKIIYAYEKSIKVNIEISTPVEHVAVEIIDLARILGIFLDNAIEAAFETMAPELSFVIVQDDQETAFIISNTFVDHQLAVSSLSRPDVSTKGEHRGMGLYNASQIIASHSNLFLDTNIKDGQFVQLLHVGLT